MTKLAPVKSSNVKAIGYDASRRALVVEFKAGGTYEYTGVSPEKHAALMAAKSIGSHIHSQIRPYHVGRKLS